MDMTISGHHVEITDAIKEHIHSKFERVERHYDKITRTEIILTVEPHEKKAEATLFVTGDTLHASATDDDMYKAIDDLVDKIDKQVRRRKDKMNRHHTNIPDQD